MIYGKSLSKTYLRNLFRPGPAVVTFKIHVLLYKPYRTNSKKSNSRLRSQYYNVSVFSLALNYLNK